MDTLFESYFLKYGFVLLGILESLRHLAVQYLNCLHYNWLEFFLRGKKRSTFLIICKIVKFPTNNINSFLI